MATPNYTVRESPKAKNLRLKVTPQDGLCVIVPRGFDETRIPDILRRKRDWIADALRNAEERRRFLEPRPIQHLPERLSLRAIGEEWTISYRENLRQSGLSLRESHSELIVTGASFARDAILAKLKGWLRRKVRESIAPLAVSLARQHGFKLGKVFVKSQRTRWASCSAHANLALNTKLLFLPPELVGYALIHELCHTMQMNHSKEFWRLVECHEPRFRTLDQQLREAWKTVPQWMF